MNLGNNVRCHRRSAAWVGHRPLHEGTGRKLTLPGDLEQTHGKMSAYGTLADMPLALTNVCFEGKNRHDAGVTPCPLMT